MFACDSGQDSVAPHPLLPISVSRGIWGCRTPREPSGGTGCVSEAFAMLFGRTVQWRGTVSVAG